MSSTHYKKGRTQSVNPVMVERLDKVGLVKPGRKAAVYGPDYWKADGEDHINIDFFGETDLGRMLDPSYRSPFRHHIFLNFNTVEGFLTFLRSRERPEELRQLVGRGIARFASAARLVDRQVLHLNAIAMDAVYQKILANARLHNLVFRNELPFDSYRSAVTGVRIRHPHHAWLIAGMAEITRAVQAGQEPDFMFLADKPTSDIYESVRPTIPQSVLIRAAEKEKKAQAHREQMVQRAEEAAARKLAHAEAKKAAELKAAMLAETAAKKKAEANNKKRASKKRQKDEFHFNPGNGCMVFPHVNPETEPYLLTTATNRIVNVNGVMIETAPVKADVEVSLKKVSQLDALAELGIISDDDVIRSGPLYPETFLSTHEPREAVKLDYFIIQDGDEFIQVPVWLKLVKRSFERPEDTLFPGRGDRQEYTLLPDGVMRFERQAVLYRPLENLTTLTNKEPSMVSDIRTHLSVMQSDPEMAIVPTYVVLGVSMTVFVTNGNENIMVTGSVVIEGVSTGTFDDATRVVTPIDVEGDSSFPVLGYLMSMYRGKLREPEPVVKELTAEQTAVEKVEV